MTYVIRLNGYIQGGFVAADDDDALLTYAKSEGFKDFKDLLTNRGLKRDNFTVEEIDGKKG